MRVLKAFLLAPVAPVLLFLLIGILIPGFSSEPAVHAESLAMLAIYSLVTALIVAYVLSLFVAAPLFLVLRRVWKPTLLICAFAAALIATLPVFGLEIQRVLTIRDGSTLTTGAGDCQSIVDNVRTACGYSRLLQEAGWLAILGALAGIVFWIVYARPAAFGFKFIATTFAAIVLGAGAFYALAYDRTCHSSYLRGRSSISPDMTIEVAAPKDDMRDFAPLMQAFASANDMQMRDSSSLEDAYYRVLSISVCRKGLNFEINDHRSARKGFESAFGRGVGIDVFVTDADEDYRAPAHDLVERLERRWPGAVRSAEGGELPSPD